VLSCDENYVEYLRAFVGSVRRRSIDAQIVVVHPPGLKLPAGCVSFVNSKPREYLKTAGKMKGKTHSNIGFCRWANIPKIAAMGYSSLCLMDADMMVTSKRVENLFDAVEGTSVIIGGDEESKWGLGPQYRYVKRDGSDVKFCQDRPDLTRMNSFFCMPVFLDGRDPKIVSLCEKIEEVKYTSYQERDGNIDFLCDMFTHNLCVHETGLDRRVVQVPMAQTTQVHFVGYTPFDLIREEAGDWYTKDGLPVYSMHGKFAAKTFVKDYMWGCNRKLELWGIQKQMEHYLPEAQKVLEKVQAEWRLCHDSVRA